MGAQLFRSQLHKLLTQRGWKLPQLAAVAGYNRSYLWELSTGRHGKRPSDDVVADLDTALRGGGSLIRAWEEDEEVDRRELLRDLGAVALVAPLAQVEQVRQGIHLALSGGDTSDQWEQIVADYAATFYTSNPQDLLADLMADLNVLGDQLVRARGRARPMLSRTAGQLATIAAMTFASLGARRQTDRWWATARSAADDSGDRRVQVWVRGWEVANGLYERRDPAQILTRAAEAVAIADNQPGAGLAGLLAGLAQTQATIGHPDAPRTLRQVAAVTEQVSAAEAADHDSMLGWPEVRLHHTRSYVYTALGDTAAAYAAQNAALQLYGADLARERAAMTLHRARCMIIDGDVSGGARYAHSVLDSLPTRDHTELVYAVARDVLTTVPRRERALVPVSDLADRLALPAGPR